MIFQYIEDESLYIYEFVFCNRFSKYVDVRCRLKTGVPNCHTAWLQEINTVDNKIIWHKEADKILHLTEGAKDYINKLLKLKAFW